MAYIIRKSNGDVITTIDIGEVDSSTTSLTLIGKNVNNYGEYINNNFIELLTNSAYNVSPLSPLEGQLWYDTAANRLKVWSGSSWVNSFGSVIDNTAPVDIGEGEFWFNSETKQSYVYENSQFWLVGPPTPPQDGLIGFYTATFNIYDLNAPLQQKYPSILYTRGEYIGAISDEAFTLQEAAGQIMYSENTSVAIVKGLTIFHDLNVKGDILSDGTNIFSLYRQESTYYDITRFGSIETQITATNFFRYTCTNYVLGNVLDNVFTPGATEFPVGSGCKVICNYKDLVTSTTLTSLAATGTDTLQLSTTTNIEYGQIIEGSFFLDPSSAISTVSSFNVILTEPLLDAIPNSTRINFSKNRSQIRSFSVQQITAGVYGWRPAQFYSRSRLDNTGTLAVVGANNSTILMNTSTTFLTSGQRVYFTGGTAQPTIGNSTITSLTIIGGTQTSVAIQTSGIGTAGTVTFDAHPFPFIATYTNIITFDA